MWVFRHKHITVWVCGQSDVTVATAKEVGLIACPSSMLMKLMQETTEEISSKVSKAAKEAEQKLGAATEKAQAMSDEALSKVKVASDESSVLLI